MFLCDVLLCHFTLSPFFEASNSCKYRTSLSITFVGVALFLDSTMIIVFADLYVCAYELKVKDILPLLCFNIQCVEDATAIAHADRRYQISSICGCQGALRTCKWN